MNMGNGDSYDAPIITYLQICEILFRLTFKRCDWGMHRPSG